MAKNQQVSGTVTTSQPERIQVLGTSLYRNSSANTDQRLINCFQESVKNDITNSYKTVAVKRPGFTSQTSPAGTGTSSGFYYWQGSFYSAIGDKVYKDTTLLITLAATPTRVGFIDIKNANTNYLICVDGTNGYRIDTSGNVVQINQTYSSWQASTNYSLGDKRVPTVSNGYYYEVTADAGSSGGSEPTWPTSIDSTVVDSGITWTCKGEYGGFPSPHIPEPKFMDGYLMLIKANSMDIYNSDVDNVLGWGASNFVSAEMWPDNLVACARQNNQYVAFGEYSSEFFYDAALGTAPFARNEGTAIQIGCAAPYAIYESERFCIFVGQSQSGGRAVWLLEGFQPKKISTENIDRVLDSSTLSTAYGYGLRTKGHLFYVLILSSITLVYDVEEKVWHQWSFNNTTFPLVFIADKSDGSVYLLGKTDSTIYKMNPTYYTDNGTTITTDLYLSKYDGGTQNRKFMHNATIIGDYISSGFSLRWSDDDYNTWSDYRNMSGRNFTSRLGSFRRRAFHIRHEANSDMRVEALEFEVDVGTH